MKVPFKTTALVLTAVTALFLAGTAFASDAPKPDWFFHDIVGVDFVQQHVAVPMPDNVVIVDARPKRAKYDKGHIPGAISIPDTYFDKEKGKLPENKDALLIFYCGGLKCKLSHKSAKKAEAMGCTNVKVFSKGFPEWMKQEGNYAAAGG